MDYSGKTTMFNPHKPFYTLPTLPPQQSLETIDLYKALVPASESLAKLSATAQSLPNPAVLYRSVALLEAKASSEIEQVITTHSNLFGFESSTAAADPMTKEVHRYAEAIQYAWYNDRPLCTPLIEKICSIIKGHKMNVRKIPGTALAKGNGDIVYTPPDGDSLLRDLLGNLFGWINENNGIHPIIKSALAHYQFESIHPFTDGNGRTGRILVVMYLVEQGLLEAPVLFLSGEILKDKSQYYSLLQSTRESNDFYPYLIWFIKLLHKASIQSISRAIKVKQAMQEVKNELREKKQSIYSQDLVNLLFSSPVIFAHQLVDKGVAGSTSTAHNYLKTLEEINIIERSERLFDRKVGYLSIQFFEALSGEIDLK